MILTAVQKAFDICWGTAGSPKARGGPIQYLEERGEGGGLSPFLAPSYTRRMSFSWGVIDEQHIRGHDGDIPPPKTPRRHDLDIPPLLTDWTITVIIGNYRKITRNQWKGDIFMAGRG